MTWSDSKGKPGCKCSTSHKSHRRASLDLNLHVLGTDDTFVYSSSCAEKIVCCFCLRGPEHGWKAERQRRMQQPGIKRSRLMALINARSIFPPSLFLVSDACKNIHNIFVLCHNNFFFQMRLSFDRKWSATLLT